MTRSLPYRQWLPLLSLAFAAATAAHADRIVVNGRVQAGVEVKEIHGQDVVTRDDSTPRTDVTRIMLEQFPIPRGTTGIILRDGTRLSGRILDRDKKRIVFYATTAGQLEVAVSQVAGVFYESADIWKPAEAKAPALITRSGEVVAARRILWADDETVAVLTGDGLRKFPVSAVSRVWWTLPAPGTGVRLRNGDVINTPVLFLGRKFSFSVAGREILLPLHAAEEINFSDENNQNLGKQDE